MEENPQEEPQQESQQPTPEEESQARLRISLAATWREFKTFFTQLVNIQEGTDIPGTCGGIKRDAEFKGIQVWILIFSIGICSIGLNTSSAAVIIGAMLISPLMGPILGVGLAVGTNDFKLLTTSLKSFMNMTAVAISTSFLYFLLTPLRPPIDELPELFARTKPTLLDVGIAVFGGLAGIIAGSRREKSNVIPGVAIATALMPPLCTAGYGLATANWNFFLGAFYLFLLNSVFICASTFVVVRYLRFPMIDFVDPKNERRIKRYILGFILLVMVPSMFIFWDVIQEFRWKRKAEEFYAENVEFMNYAKKEFHYNDTVPVIEIIPIGEPISATVEAQLKQRLKKSGLDETRLKVIQYKDNTGEIREQLSKLEREAREGFFTDIYKDNQEALINKNAQIELLEEKLLQYTADSIPFTSIRQELAIQYSNMERFSFGRTVEADMQENKDTIPTAIVKWTSGTRQRDVQENSAKMAQWLQVRLKLDTVRVINQ